MAVIRLAGSPSIANSHSHQSSSLNDGIANCELFVLALGYLRIRVWGHLWHSRISGRRAGRNPLSTKVAHVLGMPCVRRHDYSRRQA